MFKRELTLVLLGSYCDFDMLYKFIQLIETCVQNLVVIQNVEVWFRCVLQTWNTWKVKRMIWSLIHGFDIICCIFRFKISLDEVFGIVGMIRRGP